MKKLHFILFASFAVSAFAYGPDAHDTLRRVSPASNIYVKHHAAPYAPVTRSRDTSTFHPNVAMEKSTSTAISLTPHSKYPAEAYYPVWNTLYLTPPKDELSRKDTSYELVLESKYNGYYFHPCPGIITSPFGWRDTAMHKGIDLDLHTGDKVYAAFDGMVRISRRYGSFGNVVVIRHYNGLETVYAHLSKLLVKPGQVVISGEPIGLGGSTGWSTGSHLHFEIRFKGVALNPAYFISFKRKALLADTMIIKRTRWGLTAYPKHSTIYKVKRGDSLFLIARRFGLSISKLAQINGISRNRILRVGEVLRVST